MASIYMLIPVAVLLIAAAIGLFVWSVRSGQFEDLEGPAHRILMDDDDDMIPPESRPPSKQPAARPADTGRGERES
jgi:cbb3-type cytochrome oxidase maturation protein